MKISIFGLGYVTSLFAMRLLNIHFSDSSIMLHHIQATVPKQSF